MYACGMIFPMQIHTFTSSFETPSLEKIISLQQQTIHELQTKIKLLEETNETIREQYESLKQCLIDLRRQHFSSKSEKYVPEQGVLFDVPLEEPSDEAALPREKIEYERNKPKRSKDHAHHLIPEHLSRVRIEYTLPDEKRICPCGCQTLLYKVGEVISERLEHRSAELYVNQHVRFKYAGCPHDKGILIANMPTLPIARSLAGPSLLSQIIVDKYQYHLPLHRQQQRFAQQGVYLNSNSFLDWLIQVAELLKPLYRAGERNVLASPRIQTDDTPVKVRLKGSNKAKNGYLWIYIGWGNPAGTMAVYRYSHSRSSDEPKAFLGQYQGIIQADAYSGYDVLFNEKDPEHPRTEVGCWMHARRPFFKIVSQSKKEGAAHQALSYIKRLYDIEKEVKDVSVEERLAVRQAKSKPILDKFKAWLDKKINQVIPKSPIYLAIQYSLNHWVALTRYVEDGSLNIDNGNSERGMRPVALGRNNWVALGGHTGGELAAIFYSFIETCKIYEINTYEYFTDVLTRINDHPINRIAELLPYQWKIDQAAKKQTSDTS